jgi:gamma-glutamylcysteine synthetase
MRGALSRAILSHGQVFFTLPKSGKPPKMSDRNPTPQDEKLDALLETMAENTATLIDVQQQAAATSASVKDARNYIQTVARQMSWDANGKAIAAVMTKALEKDHTSLHAAARAAQEMQRQAAQIARTAEIASSSQKRRAGHSTVLQAAS